MSKGYSPKIPEVPAKHWVICDGCGKETTPIEDSSISFLLGDMGQSGWAAFHIQSKDPLHFCPECMETLSIRGINLKKPDTAVLGEDYFE